MRLDRHMAFWRCVTIAGGIALIVPGLAMLFDGPVLGARIIGTAAALYGGFCLSALLPPRDGS